MISSELREALREASKWADIGNLAMVKTNMRKAAQLLAAMQRAEGGDR